MLITLITPAQIRAARALLRMEQEELARRANFVRSDFAVLHRRGQGYRPIVVHRSGVEANVERRAEHNGAIDGFGLDAVPAPGRDRPGFC